MLLVLCLATIGFFGLLRTALDLERPVFGEEHFAQDFMKFTPAQSWSAWVAARDQRLGDRPDPVYLMARDIDFRYRWYMTIAALLGIVAVAMMVAALLLGGKTGRAHPAVTRSG